MWEAWITVLSCRLRNISQKGRNRLRTSKKVSRKHWGFWHTHTHTHTRDSQGSQHCVVIPLAKHLAGTMGRLRRWKNVLSLDSMRKEDGRKLDRIFIIICINAMQLQVKFIIHFLPVSSGFPFHTHALRSFLRVFNALRTVHVRDVTPTRDITQCRGTLALAAIFRVQIGTRFRQNTSKRWESWNIVGPYIPYDLLQTKGETCAKFGLDQFRNVDFYKFHTNKHSSLYIRFSQQHVLAAISYVYIINCHTS